MFTILVFGMNYHFLMKIQSYTNYDPNCVLWDLIFNREKGLR